jgi:lipid II:glycine glycyltransferase (peptidoglycan interpeptide bridge formation enzyme)
LLQSWTWGEFKRRAGWTVERVRVERDGKIGLAQALIRSKGPVSIGYLPRGPLFSAREPELAAALFAEVDRVCRRHRALGLIVEPESPLPLHGHYRAHGFVRGPTPIQPVRTVKTPLLADEPLLMQMHQKTRYNIRLAQRRGVTVRTARPDEVGVFYDMLRDTSGRNDFGIHAEAYYADFLNVAGDHAALLFSEIDGAPVAGLIVARFADEAIYMYGASSTQRRAHGAAFLLQFAAMRWARERGCRRYDLWGIPATDPETTQVAERDRLAPTRGEDWRGLYEFKVRFGGTIVRYPPPLERRYVPGLAALARRVYRPAG